MKESIVKWIGGKNELAPDLISKMASHERYIEVFTGSATIFLQKPLAKFNILNDLNGNLVNVYKVISDEKKKELLKNLLDNIIYSRELFEYFRDIYRDHAKWILTEQVTRAMMYVYLNRCSFNGQFTDYARRDDSAILYSLDETIDKMFNKFHAGKVVIEKLHFKELLLSDKKLKYDTEDTFIYLDPPYWVTTEPGNTYYEKLMSRSEHEDLRDILYKHKKAKWMLSYDNHSKIKELYELTEVEEGVFNSKNEDIKAILTAKLHQSSGSLNEEQVYKQELVISNYGLLTANTLFE